MEDIWRATAQRQHLRFEVVEEREASRCSAAPDGVGVSP